MYSVSQHLVVSPAAAASLYRCPRVPPCPTITSHVTDPPFPPSSARCAQDTSHTTCKGTVRPDQPLDCFHLTSTPDPSACPGHVSGWLVPGPNTTFPVPTPRQLEWMAGTDAAVGGFSMFSHFGINTFWTEGDKFDPYGTYHDCETNAQCTDL